MVTGNNEKQIRNFRLKIHLKINLKFASGQSMAGAHEKNRNVSVGQSTGWSRSALEW